MIFGSLFTRRNLAIDLVVSFEKLHRMTERACDEQQRDDQDQWFDGVADPADKSEAPDGGDDTDKQRGDHSQEVTHVQDQGNQQQAQRDRENADHLNFVGVHPAGQHGLAGCVYLVVFIPFALDQLLYECKGLPVIQQPLDEGGLDQRRAFILGDQESPDIARLVHAVPELVDFFSGFRRPVLHHGADVDSVGCGLSVAGFFGRDGKNLVVVNGRRQVYITRHPPDLCQGFGIVDIAVLALDHYGDGQWIAEIRVILVGLYEGMIFWKQVTENRAKFHPGQPGREKRSDEEDDSQGKETILQRKVRQPVPHSSYHCSGHSCPEPGSLTSSFPCS
jgi:hypothetical protein